MTLASKQDFAKWFLALPGVASWYGTDKVNQWANGVIFSHTYDDLYNHYASGNTDYVLGIVQQHTGQIQTISRNTNVYGAVITFLANQLSNQQLALQNIIGTPDDNPISESTISSEIQRTRTALQYYQSLQSSVS